MGEPIQQLTRKDVEFKWGKQQQAAFEELKRLITKAYTLVYFKVDSRTTIVADASPVGRGAVLTQFQENEWRVISYASRSLNDVERRYSQIENKALAMVWACERFSLYILGREIEQETDHKPLIHPLEDIETSSMHQKIGITPRSIQLQGSVHTWQDQHC